MQIIHVIDPVDGFITRIFIGCEEYRELFIDFALAHKCDVALMDLEQMPERSPQEIAVGQEMLTQFHQYINERILH